MSSSETPTVKTTSDAGTQAVPKNKIDSLKKAASKRTSALKVSSVNATAALKQSSSKALGSVQEFSSKKYTETATFLSKKSETLKNFEYKHERVKDLEYVDRDPEHIHSELKVNFRDVIAEPEGVHSFATVWGTSFKTYSVSKFWCYRLLTAFLGIPFALFWGIYFALLAFLNVWFVVPFVKAFVIQMKFFSKVWGLIVSTFLDPFFTSIGKIFSAIRIQLQMNRS